MKSIGAIFRRFFGRFVQADIITVPAQAVPAKSCQLAIYPEFKVFLVNKVDFVQRTSCFRDLLYERKLLLIGCHSY
ncbi:hypothetical protein BGP80_12540 [Pseudomonas putida]|uniref:Uncharacterized protein n=1 Tax=Pseudomonas putida TaxID=303 RepID=A0A2S3WDK6_PSEPU|nr:hypothetical protein BGP80_12540 [Pseudomonas putida]